MAFPAILNEVISVTGTYPFPFATGPNATPNNPPSGVAVGSITPFLLGGAFGGTAGTAGTAGTTTTAIGTGEIGALTAGDIINGIFSDRILAAANRNFTTDFAAPALDIPTFRRRIFVTTATDTTTTTNDINEHLTFQDSGTSLSAAMVTGAYALVSSALDYWTKLNVTGVTTDAYLTQPVGVRSLNFGPHALKDLSAYNNPDGINAILQWTAVPATDRNDQLGSSTPPYLFGSTQFRSYSRISVSNAIAAIEGEIALQYLIDNKVFPIIDANKNGLISAQELQDFVDNSSKIGMPEAGAMARLLGGTARIAGNSTTSAFESPDQPDVLQRRFNFFDYAADGQLNGSVSIDEFKVLAHTLLPTPDAFVVNDRQRSSANSFLVDPTAKRDFTELQHILPNYQFVPKGAFLKYRNISPARFKVNRLVPGVDSILRQLPVYALFSSGGPTSPSVITNASAGSSPKTTPVPTSVPPPTTNDPTLSTMPPSSTGNGTGQATSPPPTTIQASADTNSATSISTPPAKGTTPLPNSGTIGQNQPGQPLTASVQSSATTSGQSPPSDTQAFLALANKIAQHANSTPIGTPTPAGKLTPLTTSNTGNGDTSTGTPAPDASQTTLPLAIPLSSTAPTIPIPIQATAPTSLGNGTQNAKTTTKKNTGN